MDANYASKNLRSGVLAMMTGLGSIQGRLLQAYDVMMPIFDTDIPPPLLNDWISIRERFEQHKDPNQNLDDPSRKGDLRYTLDRISEVEAKELAEDLYRLESALETYLIQNR